LLFKTLTLVKCFNWSY